MNNLYRSFRPFHRTGDSGVSFQCDNHHQATTKAHKWRNVNPVSTAKAKYPPKTHDEIRTALDHVSKGATDMVLKLLETNPQYRLKSLRQAKIQPFFHGFDFSEVISKKVKPNEILQRYNKVKRMHDKKELPNFDEFDS